MTYNKTTWQSGDVITAEKLNNIEDALESFSNTPEYNGEVDYPDPIELENIGK